MSRYWREIEAEYDGPSPFEGKRIANALARHPDCRDPDHPGCETCEDKPKDKDDDY